MPIWSLTAERLAKLKEALGKKKVEHDELLALSEKDLWCRDLDEFMQEWENQLAQEAEIKTNIRRMGRRVSKKIGAGGGGGRGRKRKDDEEYEPEKKGRGKAKAAAKPAVKTAVKVETKTAQRFAEMFGAKPKVKKENSPEIMELSDNFSDDDFAALSRSNPKIKASSSQSQSQSEEPDTRRTKRAAASKARTMFDDDSESSDDDKMLGDVGALVKGIGKPSADSGDANGRLSLHAMSRPESSQGNSGSNALPKMKPRSAKSFDFDSPDDTNYEMLAMSSPHKAVTKNDHIDSFLSDDDDVMPAIKAPPPKSASLSSAAAKAPAGLATVKKARGRPAGTKSKAEPKAKPKAAPKGVAKTKASTLSPAAKAYAAKKGVKKSVLEDSDLEMDDPDSPPPKPAARSRRAAAARRPIVIDDDDSMLDQQDESDDPFEVDDDED